MEFEKENDIMDQRQEMMDDAIDDVTGLEDEAEGEEVVNEVLEEIGVDLRQAVSFYVLPCVVCTNSSLRWAKRLRVCKAMLWQKARLHKPLEVGILEIMIFKRGLIV
jgi:charged multivesicular body protein 2A